MTLLLALALAAPPAARADPPADLPTLRLRLRLSGPTDALRPEPASAELGLDLVWTLRGPPRARTRVPEALESPWERELRRLEEPELRPELDPLTPE